MFESEKLITLKMNASNKAIEVCISQSDDKKCLHLIAFHVMSVSRLNKTEALINSQ